ncbi:MAG TPA: 2OG-Fe(II) oxygenase [Methylophilaceae bacterium]
MLNNLLNLEKFTSTRLTQDPFQFLVVENFVDPKQQAAISKDFPRIDKAGSFPPDTLKYGASFAQFLAELEGEPFRQAVEKAFNLDLTGRPTMITVRGHTDKNDGNIHTDSLTKIITVLIYLNDSWDENSGRLRLLRSGADLEDYITEVEPGFGTLLAFKRSDNSWHGHKPFIGQRRAIQLNWVLDEDVKRHEQKRHSFSAFLKKLFGKYDG